MTIPWVLAPSRSNWSSVSTPAARMATARVTLESSIQRIAVTRGFHRPLAQNAERPTPAASGTTMMDERSRRPAVARTTAKAMRMAAASPSFRTMPASPASVGEGR